MWKSVVSEKENLKTLSKYLLDVFPKLIKSNRTSFISS